MEVPLLSLPMGVSAQLGGAKAQRHQKGVVGRAGNQGLLGSHFLG